MNGVVAMLGEVKDNLNSESFKSSLASFQSVGLALIISTPIQMHLCLLSG
jgi:hypothetical protein